VNLPSFSVKHSVFGNMLTILVLVGGTMLALSIRRETFPEVELDMVSVTTIYPNASPEEVEDLVTIPIEDKIRDVEDVEEFTSVSAEGRSIIIVKIDPDARYKDRVLADVQHQVDLVNDLPEEAEDPVVKSVTTRRRVLAVSVSGNVPEKTLRDYADYLKTRLQEIEGVGEVTITGWRDEEFWVEVDPERARRMELSLLGIARVLRQRNVTLPGGKIPQGTREIILRSAGRFHTPDDVSRVVIRSDPDGHYVRLSDLAGVRRAFEENSAYARADGLPTLMVNVTKRRSGDTLHIADAVRSLVADESVRLPKGVRIKIVDDISYYVRRRLKVLGSNGLFGMILVLGTLLVFLNARVAVITALGIPFSLLVVILLMAVSGVTVNLVTMFGLIIVLGMLVDDSIIVGENIFRYMEEGLEPRAAAVKGTTEVMFPVISTVLTTLAAFGPLALIPDIIGKFIRWMPLVIAMALCASLFEALVILPCHAADFVRPLPEEVRRRNARRLGQRIMRAIDARYTTAIRTILRLRYLFLAVVLLAFLAMLILGRARLRIDLFPSNFIDVFTVRITTPRGTSLDGTEKAAARIEKHILALPTNELQNAITVIGAHLDGRPAAESGEMATHYATITTFLTPQNKRARKTQAIINQLRRECAGIKGIDHLEFASIKPGPPVGAAVDIKVRGRDYAVLQSIASNICDFLKKQPGVYDVRDNYEAGKDEIHVKINETEAARLGVNMSDIARTVYAAFQGLEATSIYEGKNEIKIRVKLARPWRDRLSSLENLVVPNYAGRLIPLTKVARLERMRGRPNLHHHDGDRIIEVTASIDERLTSSASVSMAVMKEFRGIPKQHPGYSLISAGEWKETRKLLRSIVRSLLIAMLLIYAILVVQFDSFLQPLVVMGSIPLGAIGVIIALILHHQPLSLMALFGMVGLTGVVVNDAIVLVSFINDLRRNRGVLDREAIVAAGRRRVRPILLTTITTVAGLLPVIYGIGGYEPFVAPAAIALAYGLIFATILTLFVIPSVYMVALDVRAIPRRIRSWWRR